jgi:hypothetical protein
MQARGIDVDRLIRAFSMDTDDAVTRGLRFTEVIEIFCPSSLFNSVDLPTFGRPTMAINPQ